MCLNLFNIIGPVMIGPSSSHTAGAARIGRAALCLLGDRCVKADIRFHGSFAKTYKGHGTDRAIVGGLLNMDADDVRIRRSLQMAISEGMEVSFAIQSFPGAHPNTVEMALTGAGGKRITVRCSSLGGGAIRIDEADGITLGISGENDSLIIRHSDTTGVIAAVTGMLAREGVNIASIRDFRAVQGGKAVMTIETDSSPTPETLQALERTHAIESVAYLTRRAY
jgi:L-serine dehydratase